MTANGTQRIEFTPGKDILGKTIERNETGRRRTTVLRGL